MSPGKTHSDSGHDPVMMRQVIEGLRLDVGSSRGKVSNPVLQRFPALRSIRASFELAPGDADVSELRLRLMRDDRPATETWLYRWTAS